MPSAELDDGILVRAIAGALGTVPGLGRLQGPVQDTNVDTSYFDVVIPVNGRLAMKVKEGYTAIAYVLEGEIRVPSFPRTIRPRSVSLFSRAGDGISITAERGPARVVILSSKPLNEPVAWYGPVVMNGEEQLAAALRELSEGIFAKKAALWKDLD
ncbi:pirin-like C-terminal cupin domain-containing protein [Tardisphaera miroshnichenkoae]